MLDSFPDLVELRLRNVVCDLPPRGRKAGYSNLKVLDLRHTNLTGDLSQSLFAGAEFLFPSLTFLDLSGNSLSGPVPLTFTQMANLTVLNLSNNRLSGEIPPLPRALLNPSFFDGNPLLCGPPLEACKSPRNDLVVKLVAALISSVAALLVSSLLFGWRLRVYSIRHRDDAQLIAAMQGKNSANLMPLSDLRKATDNFAEQHQIGVGGFGTVYKGKLGDGTDVAIKRSKRQGSEQDKEQFLNEVNILSHVNHRNLVRLLGCCLENKVALLVLEFVLNGTLKHHLRGSQVPLTWGQRLQIAVQTADALSYLHSAANPPIIHRDIKSENILLDDGMNAKVADFGISKLAPSLDATHVTTQAVQGTLGYIDPEYYTTFQLSAKSDVFSFGVVLLELISARALVDLRRGAENPSLAQFAVSLIRSGNMEDMIDPPILETFINSAAGKESILEVGTLAVNCLEPTSRDRPSMKEVWKVLQGIWLQFDPTLSSLNQQPSSNGQQLPELAGLGSGSITTLEQVSSMSYVSNSYGSLRTTGR